MSTFHAWIIVMQLLITIKMFANDCLLFKRFKMKCYESFFNVSHVSKVPNHCTNIIRVSKTMENSKVHAVNLYLLDN